MKVHSFILIFVASLIVPSFGQDSQCPTEVIAYLPLTDCTHYKLCINGAISEMQCPGGLYFNPNLNNCDLPQHVPDCIEGRRGVLTKCGQTLTANFGSIEYKLNQTYDAGELCVFILRHNYSSNPGFRFVLETHGINDMDRNLIVVYTIEPGPSYNPKFVYKTSFLGPPNLIPVQNIPGFVAVVIFKPYSSSGTGFKLSYKATGDMEMTLGHNAGVNLVFNNVIGAEYPEFFTLHSNCTGLRCVDVFAWTNEDKMIIDPASQIELALNLYKLELPTVNTPCFDMFAFEHEYIQELSSQSNRCWSNTTLLRYKFNTRGMLIATFTYFPDTQEEGNILWKKIADPEHTY